MIKIGKAINDAMRAVEAANQAAFVPIKISNLNRLIGLALFFFTTFVISWVAVVHIDLTPVFPSEFVVMLLLLPVPFAICFESVSAMPVSVSGRVGAIVSIGFVLLIVIAFDKWYLWDLLAVAVLAVDHKRPRQWNLLFICALVTTFGYTTLWNINYIVTTVRL